MIGRYDEEIREGLEDWEYMLRAMSKRLWGGTRTSLPSLHVLYLSPLSLCGYNTTCIHFNALTRDSGRTS